MDTWQGHSTVNRCLCTYPPSTYFIPQSCILPAWTLSGGSTIPRIVPFLRCSHGPSSLCTLESSVVAETHPLLDISAASKYMQPWYVLFCIHTKQATHFPIHNSLQYKPSSNSATIKAVGEINTDDICSDSERYNGFDRIPRWLHCMYIRQYFRKQNGTFRYSS